MLLALSHSQLLWLMVAVQLAMIGLSWLGALRLAGTSRAAMRALVWFNLVMASGVLLVAMRGAAPPWLTDTLADLCVLLGFVLVFPAGELVHVKVPRKELWTVLAVGGGAILWLGRNTDNGQLRVVALFFAIAWLMLRAGQLGFGALRSRTLSRWQTYATRLLIGVTWAVGLIFGGRAATGLMLDQPVETSHDAAANLAMIYLFVVAILFANLAFAYVLTSHLMGQLRLLSHKDMLTGLLNRLALTEFLAVEWARFQRERKPFSVLCIDVDHFKSVNDSFGHAAGDAVLKAVA